MIKSGFAVIPTVVLMMALPCVAQEAAAPVKTLGLVNGRFWLALSHHDGRAGYLIGFHEAITSAFGVTLDPHASSMFFSSNMTFAEIEKAVDRFYESPEYLPIPIMAALRIVSMKASGAPQAEIDAELDINRKLSASPPK